MPEMTKDIARAVATDAGNKAMWAAGRTEWSDEDYLVACRQFEALWPLGRELAGRRKRPSGGNHGGRPKSAERCPCGRYSLPTARRRHHTNCAAPQISTPLGN